VIFAVLDRVLRAQTPKRTDARNITYIDDKITAAAARSSS
jgi:cysteinyl-tRNA synthetase